MVDYEVHDDLIDDKIREDVYQWSLDQNFYCNHNNTPPIKYKPNRDGVHLNSPWYGDVDPEGKIKDQLQTTMYRIPCGWDNDSCHLSSKPVWELWKLLNDKLFDGKATLDGPGEGISGSNINREREPEDWERFGLSNVHQMGAINKRGWTSFINARWASHRGDRNNAVINGFGQRIGFIHKDTRKDWDKKPGRFVTVLLNLNPVWKAEWMGELLLFDDDWPSVVIPHKPSSVVVFDHMTSHRTLKPAILAPEMSYKAAFRASIL